METVETIERERSDQVGRDTSDIPLVCTLSQAEKDTRGDDFRAMLAQVEQIEELADGYAFRFPGDEVWLPRLVGFIRAERACCQFFRFELTIEPGLGPIWLRIRGAEGVKEIIATGFLS